MPTNNTSQAFWIAAGNFFALMFTIGATMVLSRCYTEVDYGTYRQVFWVYSSLSVVFTLGLPRTFGYFLPQVPLEEGLHLVNKITKLFFIMGGIFSLILFLFSDIIADILKNPDLGLGLKLFSPVPFFMLPTMGLDSIFATYKRTHIASAYNIIHKALLSVCLIIPALIFRDNYIYAIIGFNISSFISFLFALYLKRLPFKSIPRKKTGISYKSIFAFAVPLMGANIVNIIINSTDQFFISRFFGVVEFAQYSNGAMELPFISMIIGAFSVVLLPVYTKLKEGKSLDEFKAEIFSVWKSVFEKSIKLIYPIIIYCIVFANEIMVLLYSEKYFESGLFFRIMLFNNFFSIISSYPLILALGKTKAYLNTYIFNALILIILETLVVYLVPNVYLICIISVFCLAVRMIAFLRIISVQLKTKIIKLFPLRMIFKVSLISIAILIPIKLLTDHINTNSLIAITISGLLYIILFLPITHLFKLNYWSIVKPLFRR